jgi:hypothetical protein
MVGMRGASRPPRGHRAPPPDPRAADGRRAGRAARDVRAHHPPRPRFPPRRRYLLAGTAEGRRTFRVSRIEALELTGEAADEPAGFDLATEWAAARRDFFERMQVITVTVEVAARAVLPFTRRPARTAPGRRETRGARGGPRGLAALQRPRPAHPCRRGPPGAFRCRRPSRGPGGGPRRARPDRARARRRQHARHLAVSIKKNGWVDPLGRLTGHGPGRSTRRGAPGTPRRATT